MTVEDAWKFPFIGSAVLFGLYLAFKWFSKEYINLLLSSYFLLFGILAVAGSVKPLVLRIFPSLHSTTPLFKKSFVPFWRSKDSKEEPFKIELDKADLVSGSFGLGVGIWYAFTKHWVANNILGLCFSIEGIALLSLGSYKIGSILLGGLFFYDIFWVFGTDVMVTVAKSFDAPIKLVFPKNLLADPLQFSMLGLGDIVIPGVFIALLLRFDVKSNVGRKSTSKPYFWVTFAAYFLGLLTTIVVMHTFRAAQPALLYLVPACLGSSFLCAFLRNEITALLSYSEDTISKEPQDQSNSSKKEE
eukprot:TRINITY_DN1156_c0_g2_i2.p1 TRINITY_DN1156_c0_g2~~TRINITY_DN1156_c0_g2_i2.p1  ORF type:complete len:302 (-),score=74.76 TRINITY_DN1156_c0_g2_i2:150-1055(-)